MGILSGSASPTDHLSERPVEDSHSRRVQGTRIGGIWGFYMKHRRDGFAAYIDKACVYGHLHMYIYIGVYT